MPETIIHRFKSPSTRLSYLSNIPASPGNAPITEFSLMIHGWGCGATHYIPLIEQLLWKSSEAQYEHLFLAIDLPGHGESPASALPKPENGGIADLIIALCEEVLQRLQNAGSINPNVQLKTVLYGHSMGTRTAFELCSFLASDKARSLNLSVSRVILLDGSWSGDSGPQAIDMNVLQQQAKQYKETIQERLGPYFGPRTTREFEAQTREMFQRLDYGYALRIGYWYGIFDATLPQVLDEINRHNRQLMTAGKAPIKFLNIQSQEVDSNGRHGLKKGDTTTYMTFLRRHLAPWLDDFVVEGRSHYPHVDDQEAVANLIAFLHEIESNS